MEENRQRGCKAASQFGSPSVPRERNAHSPHGHLSLKGRHIQSEGAEIIRPYPIVFGTDRKSVTLTILVMLQLFYSNLQNWTRR